MDEVSECVGFGFRANMYLCARYIGGNNKQGSHHRLCLRALLGDGDPPSMLLQHPIHEPHNIRNCIHNVGGSSLAAMHSFCHLVSMYPFKRF